MMAGPQVTNAANEAEVMLALISFLFFLYFFLFEMFLVCYVCFLYFFDRVLPLITWLFVQALFWPSMSAIYFNDSTFFFFVFFSYCFNFFAFFRAHTRANNKSIALRLIPSKKKKCIAGLVKYHRQTMLEMLIKQCLSSTEGCFPMLFSFVKRFLSIEMLPGYSFTNLLHSFESFLSPAVTKVHFVCSKIIGK